MTPKSIPEGLTVELSRGRVLPGASAEADRWMAMLDDRVDECVASLDAERMAIEIVFRLREDGEDYLYWVSVHGPNSGELDLSQPIDRDHLAAAKRSKHPGWVEAEPQVLLLPEPVRKAVMNWRCAPVRLAEQPTEPLTGPPTEQPTMCALRRSGRRVAPQNAQCRARRWGGARVSAGSTSSRRSAVRR